MFIGTDLVTTAPVYYRRLQWPHQQGQGDILYLRGQRNQAVRPRERPRIGRQDAEADSGMLSFRDQGFFMRTVAVVTP